MSAALIAEATRRSGVVWVVGGAGPGRLVWHLWHDGAAHLVVDGTEQPLPQVRSGDRVLVIVRSRQRQADRVVQWWATVLEVAPGSPGWRTLAPLLAAQRLNAPDGEHQPARWATGSRILTLTPDGTSLPVER